jgi:hypothetical protein
VFIPFIREIRVQKGLITAIPNKPERRQRVKSKGRTVMPALLQQNRLDAPTLIAHHLPQSG